LLNEQYDIIVITTGHKDYRSNKAVLDRMLSMAPCMIYDTIGVLTNEEIATLAGKHTVKVIGRGDI
jgi:UDP-N-acetyl-D-mannosaminuronate dehydrogenase